MKIKYFDLAKKVSRKSDHRNYHIGAVIVKKNKILSFGFNREKTHPKSLQPFQHLHAEIDAIIGVEYEDLQGSTIYVFRENKQGQLAMSKPCMFCQAAIKQARIKNLCYTVYGGYKKETV